MTDLLQGVNLYLIGMMGAGKSSIGRLLAKELGYHFFDTDTLIEQATGQPITQLFTESGEETFRQIETQVLSQLSAYTRKVIATGGGIVTRRENWSYLHHGIIVWLDVPPEELFHRLKRDTTRPLLQTDNPLEKLRQLSQERRSLYAQADLQVTIVPPENPKQVTRRILQDLPTILRPPQSPPEFASEN